MKKKKSKNLFKDKNDPQGWYTGNPIDDDMPIQDADDL